MNILEYLNITRDIEKFREISIRGVFLPDGIPIHSANHALCHNHPSY